MDRREWLTAFGAGGAGLVLGGHACAQHGEAKADNKFMAAASGFHHHFCGIHAAKKDPKFQLITQHYCLLGEKVHQCLLFEKCDAGAKLLGVEYIISDEAYRKLDDAEKAYWHPHAYEVMGGGLTAPGMTPEKELEFMGVIMTTWGKTWHTWPDPSTEYPVGEPLLMWSLGADGQAAPGIVEARDKLFNVKADAIREARAKKFGFEVPNVPFPKDLKEVGRQWTASGEDKPTKRK
jgi:hypothetical protein